MANYFITINLLNNIIELTSRDSLMVRCQAHNLETVIACEGSNPSPATKKTELEFSSMSDICFMNIGVVALDSRKNACFCYGFSEVNRGRFRELQIIFKIKLHI